MAAHQGGLRMSAAQRERVAQCVGAMKPLAELPTRAGIRGVLADIDDTLTTDGRLTRRGLRARSSA